MKGKKDFYISYGDDLISCWSYYIPTRTYVKYSTRSLAVQHTETSIIVMKVPIQMVNSDVYDCVQIHVNEKLTADNTNDNHASFNTQYAIKKFACLRGKGNTIT